MERGDDLPFVSVIIPVYNDAVRLRRCLEALAAHDLPAGALRSCRDR